MAETETPKNTETPIKSEEAPVVEPKTEDKTEEDPEDWKKTAERIAQSREDRVRTQYSKQVKDLQKEIEMMRVEKMSENEKREYEAQQLKEALEAKERDLTRREMELLAVKTLEEKKLPTSFLEFVIGDNEENTKTRIAQIEKVFLDEIKATVDIKLKAHGREPSKGRSGTDVNSFEGMSQKEIKEKAMTDLDWWRKNEDAIIRHFNTKK